MRLDGNTRIERALDVSSGGPFGQAGLVADGQIGRPGTTLYLGFLQRVTAVPSPRPSDAAYLRYYSCELKRADGDSQRVLLIGHDDRSLPSPTAATARPRS